MLKYKKQNMYRMNRDTYNYKIKKNKPISHP